jgi:hypothetical protein
MQASTSLSAEFVGKSLLLFFSHAKSMAILLSCAMKRATHAPTLMYWKSCVTSAESGGGGHAAAAPLRRRPCCVSALANAVPRGGALAAAVLRRQRLCSGGPLRIPSFLYIFFPLWALSRLRVQSFMQFGSLKRDKVGY